MDITALIEFVKEHDGRIIIEYRPNMAAVRLDVTGNVKTPSGFERRQWMHHWHEEEIENGGHFPVVADSDVEDTLNKIRNV